MASYQATVVVKRYALTLVYDHTRVFVVLYGAVQYGISCGRTRTRTAVRCTFYI